MKSLALIAVASACLLFSCSGPSHSPGDGKVKVSNNRKPAPDFTLKDADGMDVKLSQYRGKVVLLNFWATWCGPCQLEIPWFIDFEKQYKSQGLEVIGVSMDDEGWPVIKPFVASHKMNYRVLLGNDQVTQLYGGIDALPTTFLIDRQGRIAKAHVGLAGRNEYQDEIKSLLGS